MAVAAVAGGVEGVNDALGVGNDAPEPEEWNRMMPAEGGLPARPHGGVRPKRMMCRVSDNPAERRQVIHLDVAETPNSTYPSQWFIETNNPLIKPHITVRDLPQGANRHHLRTTVERGLREHTIDAELATAYLWSLLVLNPQRLARQWASFGRVIGNANQEVNITNLFHLTQGQPLQVVAFPAAAGAAPGAQDPAPDVNIAEAYDGWMGLIICGMYRLNQIQAVEHRNRVQAHLMERAITHGCPQEFGIDALLPNVRCWETNQNFVAVLSGIDMLLVKFPKHPFAHFRIGTLITRFRDCAALTALSYICKALAFDCAQLASWIWNAAVRDDFDRITKGGEEVDQDDSYTPYSAGLGLFNKSPYSAGTNPNFAFWVHVIGTTLNVDRSRNARRGNDIPVASLVMTGAICGYAQLVQTEATPQYTETGEDYIPGLNEVLAMGGAPRVRALNTPENLDGLQWFAWFYENGRTLPEIIERRVGGIWRGMEAPRPGTVGMALRTFYPE